MRTLTKSERDSLTPQHALEILKEGNRRFMGNIKFHRNLLQQVNETSAGQFPFAAILSCIDSRTSAELIFDQGLGDVFSIRIAGNILNDDILGSMEFACKIAGSKLIVVLGHTKCGAIESAFNNISLGHVTGLLQKIKPAIEKESEKAIASDDNVMKSISITNVLYVITNVRKQSPILKKMEDSGEIMIIGGIYDIDTGNVTFLNRH